MSLSHILSLTCFLVFIGAVVVGYGFCYFVSGPRILKRHNIRKVEENFIWIGSFFNLENELKQLAESTNDKQALRILKTIKASKILSMLSFVIFLLFFVASI